MSGEGGEGCTRVHVDYRHRLAIECVIPIRPERNLR